MLYNNYRILLPNDSSLQASTTELNFSFKARDDDSFQADRWAAEAADEREREPQARLQNRPRPEPKVVAGCDVGLG